VAAKSSETACIRAPAMLFSLPHKKREGYGRQFVILKETGPEIWEPLPLTTLPL
jgi:hypothetical protein